MLSCIVLTGGNESMEKKFLSKKQAVVLVSLLLFATLFTTTVYAQCTCKYRMAFQTEDHWWDQDGDGEIDPPVICGMISTAISWLQDNNPLLYWELYGQYNQGNGHNQYQQSQYQGQGILDFSQGQGFFNVIQNIQFLQYDDQYDDHPLNETFTLYELEQHCNEGTLGLIWSLIAPGLISCLMGCVGDAIAATASFATAIILFLTGVGFAAALLFAGFSGAEYAIAMLCYDICMAKFGG
jgi:hypothetical protein